MTGGFAGDECDPFRVGMINVRLPVALPPAIELVAFGDPEPAINCWASLVVLRDKRQG